MPASRHRINRATRQHGMTHDDYVGRMIAQGKRCAACGTPAPPGVVLQWDHDHTHCPGAKGCRECVRDLVCAGCNSRIAVVENALRFDTAPILAYLAKWAKGRNTTQSHP